MLTLSDLIKSVMANPYQINQLANKNIGDYQPDTINLGNLRDTNSRQIGEALALASVRQNNEDESTTGTKDTRKFDTNHDYEKIKPIFDLLKAISTLMKYEVAASAVNSKNPNVKDKYFELLGNLLKAITGTHESQPQAA